MQEHKLVPKPPIINPPQPIVTETPGAETNKMRQIIIETDGNSIHLIKSEVLGRIELVAILENLTAYLRQPPQKVSN